MHSGGMGQITGQDLKQIRENKGLTLEDAARETCLRAGLLRELEESAGLDTLPEVYQNLSLRMYARYLGLEVEPARTPVREKAKSRITPVTNFIRRMGRPPKPPRLDRNQRTKLLTLAKTTSAAIVTVVAVGLWSLNAKLSRLNFDEKPVELVHDVQAAAPGASFDLRSDSPAEAPHVVPEEIFQVSPQPETESPKAGQP